MANSLENKTILTRVIVQPGEDRETTLMTIEWENRVMTDKINPTVGQSFHDSWPDIDIYYRAILIANCFELFKLVELIHI